MSTQTINHGLGVAPELIIAKNRTLNGSGNGDWAVWHKDLSSGKYLVLNLTTAEDSWTDALFSNIGTTSVDVQNDSGSGIYLNDGMGPDDYVAYFFASKAGYSKMGSYTGNGSADGPFVYCGFRPAMIFLKDIDSSDRSWFIFDGQRSTYNVVDETLKIQSPLDETSVDSVDFLSNGFKIRHDGSSSSLNNGSHTHIFYAVAESPFKYASAR